MNPVLHSLAFRLASDPVFFVPYLLLVGSIAIALLRRTPFLASRRLNRYLWVLYPTLALAVAGLFLALGSPMAYYATHSDIEYPLLADFAGQVELLGYTLSNPVAQPGSAVRLTLYWYARTDIEIDYSLFVHVVQENGIRIAQSDHLVRGDYPSSQWLPGEIVTEMTSIDIPPDVNPGEYSIALGLYRWQTGERLPAFVGGQRLDGDALFLPQLIEVAEP